MGVKIIASVRRATSSSSHVLKPVKAAFQGAKPDELISDPILIAKLMVNEFAMQFFHAGREIILKLKIRKQFV